MQKNVSITPAEDEIFGKIIHTYTRAQAIEDGQLVDVSRTLEPCPFKFPVAMTNGAYHATLAAGGRWVPGIGHDGDDLELPGGQDVRGRLHDVFNVLLWKAKTQGGQRIEFSVLVDVHGNGRPSKVDLYAVVGPGDQGEPVITIMLPNED